MVTETDILDTSGHYRSVPVGGDLTPSRVLQMRLCSTVIDLTG